MGLAVVTTPAYEPVSLEHCRQQTGLVQNADDGLLERLIAVARAYVEKRLGRAIMPQTLRLTLDEFPCEGIELPRPPLQLVDSIVYLDADGAQRTLDDDLYEVDTALEPGRITLAYNQDWPQTLAIENAVTVTYQAGYSIVGANQTATTEEQQQQAVPADLRHAILLLVTHLYDNRSATADGPDLKQIPLGLDALLEGLSPGGYA